MRRPLRRRFWRQSRLSEAGRAPNSRLRRDRSAPHQLPPFDIEFVSVAHSIPESNALIIRTKLGTVLHTGDWKLDPTPVIAHRRTKRNLRDLGDRRLPIAVIGDRPMRAGKGGRPRNATLPLRSRELIGRARQSAVAVTTFASNVARIQAVADAAALPCEPRGSCAGVVRRHGTHRPRSPARNRLPRHGVQDFAARNPYGYLPA